MYTVQWVHGVRGSQGWSAIQPATGQIFCSGLYEALAKFVNRSLCFAGTYQQTWMSTMSRTSEKIEMSRMSKMSRIKLKYRMLEYVQNQAEEQLRIRKLSRYRESGILSTHTEPGLSNSATGWHITWVLQGNLLWQRPQWITVGMQSRPLVYRHERKAPTRTVLIQDVQAQGTEVRNFQRNTYHCSVDSSGAWTYRHFRPTTSTVVST